MTETPVNHPIRISLLISGSVLLFSIMNMFIKLVAEIDIPTSQILFFRCAIGLIPLAIFMYFKGGLKLCRTKRYGGHFFRSFVGFISTICFFQSFVMLPLANATAIHFSLPLILTALSVFMLGEKVGPHRWIAVIVGLGAVVFMLQPAGDGNIAGSIIAMGAAVFGAFAMIAVRRLGQTEHALTITLYFTLYTLLFSAIWAAFVWVPPSATAIAYLVAIGLLGGVAQIWLTYAYAKAPAAFVSIFSYLSIVFVSMMDYFVWGVVLPWQVAVGSVIVIGSGLYILYRETKKKQVIVAEVTPGTDMEPAPTPADRRDPV